MAERSLETVKLYGNHAVTIPKLSLRERLGFAIAGIRSTSEKEFFKRRTAGDVTNEPLTDPYGQHPVIRACIDACKDNIAGVPWRIYKEKNTRSSGRFRARDVAYNNFNRRRFMFDQKGDLYARALDKEYEIVEEGKLSDLFVYPNPVTPSTALFWESTIIYLLRDGECVTYAKDRPDVSKIPSQLWPKAPFRFSVKAYGDDGETPAVWNWINQKGQTKQLNDWELIRPRSPNPNDLNRGIPPYMSGQIGTQTDWYAMLFNRNFFKNGAQLGGLLLSPPGQTDTQRKAIKEAFIEEQGGVDNAFGLWLASGVTDYKELGTKHRDMHFIDLRKYSREELAMLYRTPMTILSVYEQVNYANARVQDKAYWRLTLIPIMRHIEDLYWSSLFRWVEGGKYWGAFDLTAVEALQEDLKGKLENAQILSKMLYPINQINNRLDLGMDEVPWGNTAFVPITVITADDVVSGATVPSQQEPAGEQSARTIARVIPSKSKREQIWKSWTRFLLPFEKKFDTEYNKYLYKLRTSQLREVGNYKPRSGKSPSQNRQGMDQATANQIADLLLFNEEQWNNTLVTRAKPIYISVMEASGELASDMVGGQGLYDITDPRFVQSLALKEQKIKVTNETLKNNLRVQLVEGLIDGESANQLQERVRKVFNFHANRSLTIARTEIAQAAEAARMDSFKVEGVPGKWWLTAGDRAVRVSHSAAMAEGVIPIDMIFSSTQCQYPADMLGPPEEIINCRCVLMPAEKV